MNLNKIGVAKINDLQIDVEKLHVLKMLEATFTKGGYMFIQNQKFTTTLMEAGLCVEYPENDLAVVGTQKLTNLMPSIENSIYGN